MNNTIKKILTVLSTFNIIIISLYQADAQSTFSSDRIRAASIEHLNKVFGNEAQTTFLINIPDIYFKENEVTARCKVNRQINKNQISIIFEFFDGEMFLKSLEIPVRIKISVEAPVANNFLKSGKSLTKGDFSLHNVEIFAEQDLKIPDINKLEGCILKKSVRKGEAITKEFIEDELIVRRGDKIIVQVQSGAVRVRASAYAMQDGRTGESIKLKFENNILQGYVAEDGTVLITQN